MIVEKRHNPAKVSVVPSGLFSVPKHTKGSIDGEDHKIACVRACSVGPLGLC